MLQLFKKFFEKVNTVLGFISGGAFFFAGLILFVEVICRYSGHPTIWIPETALYLFAGAMLLGAPYTLLRERHVRVELITCRLPRRAQDILFLCTSLVGTAFCLLVAQYAWVELMDVIKTGETTSTPLRVPLWLKDMPMLIGFSLLSVQFLIQAYDRVVRLQQGSPLEGQHRGGSH